MKRISDERRAEILQFWKDHRHKWTINTIAKKTGVSRDTLFRIVGLTKKKQKARINNRQRDVYQFIIATFAADLRWPTIAEIQDSLGIAYPTSAYLAVKALESKGYIFRKKDKARSISIPGLAGRLAMLIHRHSREHFANVKNGTRRK